MANTAFLTLILLSSTTLVSPLCFGWFDYDDDDDSTGSMVNSTPTNVTMTSKPILNCQALDDVFSYFNDLYEYLDQTFNPFYEPPESPPVIVFNTTDLNVTSTTPAPAKKAADS